MLFKVDDRMKPIVNRSINPSSETTTNGLTNTGISLSRPSTPSPFVGTAFERSTKTAASDTDSTYRWTSANHTATVTTSARHRRVVHVRPSVARNVQCNIASTPTTWVACPAGVWTRVMNFINSSGSRAFYVYTQGMDQNETLDTDGRQVTWGRDAMVDYNYIDGSMPGCAWTGTAHNSASVGYPVNGWRQ